MKINWSKRAIAELDSIAAHIEQDQPEAAERLVTRILAEISSLSSLSERGKPGRVENIREIFFLPSPYFAVYRISADEVRVLRIRHGARRWPAGN